MKNLHSIFLTVILVSTSACFSEATFSFVIAPDSPSKAPVDLLAGPKMGKIALSPVPTDPAPKRPGSGRVRDIVTPRAWLRVLMSIDLKPKQRQDFQKRARVLQELMKNARPPKNMSSSNQTLSEEARKKIQVIKDQIVQQQLEIWSLLELTQQTEFRQKIIERRHGRAKSSGQDQVSPMQQ